MTSVFDLNDKRDIKANLELSQEKEDKFGKELHDLFVKAKQEGIENLTIDQITVAHYRVYVKTGKSEEKNAIQIMNKLWALAKRNKFNIKKVKGKKGKYYLDEEV